MSAVPDGPRITYCSCLHRLPVTRQLTGRQYRAICDVCWVWEQKARGLISYREAEQLAQSELEAWRGGQRRPPEELEVIKAEPMAHEVVVRQVGVIGRDSKLCLKCEEVKAKSEFRGAANSGDGFRHWCRGCEDGPKEEEIVSQPTMTQVAPVTERRCGKCGETLPASAFGRHARTRDRLQHWCRACKSGPHVRQEEQKAAVETVPQPVAVEPVVMEVSAPTDLMTVKEAAEQLDVTSSMLQRGIRAGHLQTYGNKELAAANGRIYLASLISLSEAAAFAAPKKEQAATRKPRADQPAPLATAGPISLLPGLPGDLMIEGLRIRVAEGVTVAYDNQQSADVLLSVQGVAALGGDHINGLIAALGVVRALAEANRGAEV
jgi:hypothetical protein